MTNDLATTKNTGGAKVLLNPDIKSPKAKDFEDKLMARIVGQERAVRRLSGLYQIYLAGMNNPRRCSPRVHSDRLSSL